MTEEEITNGIGRLVTRYSENEKRLALLKMRLRDFADVLSDLGQALKEPERIELLERPALKTYALRSVLVDGGAVWDAVSQYREALHEKAELESSLEQAGIGNIKNPPQGRT